MCLPSAGRVCMVHGDSVLQPLRHRQAMGKEFLDKRFQEVKKRILN